MGPGIYPDDQLIAKWAEEYGTTGVKFCTLMLHPQNEGYVAAYRELSLSERMTIARLEEIEGSPFDLDTMLVSRSLLWPSLDSFPHPTFAVGELSSYVRQHGHGPLGEEEDELNGIPEHMAIDIRNARRAGQRLFEDDSPHRSLYLDLVLSLCVRNGNVDIQLLDYLTRLPLGRLRDLLATTEQVYHIIQTETLKDPKADKKLILSYYQSPFGILDSQTKGATVPGFDVPNEKEPDKPKFTAGNLPPNTPITHQALTDLIEK